MHQTENYKVEMWVLPKMICKGLDGLIYLSNLMVDTSLEGKMVVHIIETSGEIVTTINNRPNSAHLNKVKNEARRPITEQEYSFIKQYAGN